MIIFYNESSKPYENQPYGELNKIIKSNKIEYANGRQVLRQCFVTTKDKLMSTTKMDNLIDMEKPVVLSHHKHQLIFGNRDLNPMAWAIDGKEVNRKDKDIFIITLTNSINSHFQLLDNRGYYILEYSVSHGEFSIIFARDVDSDPVEFEIVDLDTRTARRYSIEVNHTNVEFSKTNAVINVKYVLHPLKKFRPAHPTRYIVTFNKNNLLKDKNIRISNHDIMEIRSDSDIDKVIANIKSNSIKAVTFYGEPTEGNKYVRDTLQNAFRIYYEMYRGKVNKVKVN